MPGQVCNNTVKYIFPSNCIVHNRDGKSYLEATKDLPAGVELFWSYHSTDMWQNTAKLMKSHLVERREDILFRDNEEENDRINAELDNPRK